MGKHDYRKGKIQVYGIFLNKDDAKLVQGAIERASQKTGVTNNYKLRFALIEMAQHYLTTTTDTSGEQ